VTIDGETSEPVKVRSGVPQVTVLGPLLFLLYVNDIGSKVKESRIKLFADDCLLYREVNNDDDAAALQRDLNALEEWSATWQMRFNAAKCYVLPVLKKGYHQTHKYSLSGQTLQEKHHYPYLGVELQGDLKWDQHISNITAKANRVLGFIRRNLNMCPLEIKCSAYYALVRSNLEYASSAWDPYQKQDIDRLESVQRRACRLLTGNRSREQGTMTAALQQIGWNTLENRRRVQRLVLLHKAVYGKVALQVPPYFVRPEKTTRQTGSENETDSAFINMYARTDLYKHSFYPRTIKQWNSLPPDIRATENAAAFKKAVGEV